MKVHDIVEEMKKKKRNHKCRKDILISCQGVLLKFCKKCKPKLWWDLK